MSWGKGRKAPFVVVDDPMKDLIPLIGTVYLICFDRPFYHARHYLGFTEDVVKRFERHLSGDGSKLLRAVNAAGIGYKIVRTWEGVDRNFERKLHKRGSSKELCPVCNPKSFAANGRLSDLPIAGDQNFDPFAKSVHPREQK